MNKNVVVIGAGFGGLSTACLLAKEGFKVTVVEKNEQTGGRARLKDLDGFTFDMGPSWYMMPKIFDNFFAQFGKKTSDYYNLSRLDPSYRVYFGGGKSYDISADIAKNYQLFDKLEPGGGKKLEAYLKDFMSEEFLVSGTDIDFFDIFDNYVRQNFSSEEIIKILEFMVVFLGGAPKNIPAMYSVLSHIDLKMGVWYPQGGLGEVAKAMQALASELGVEFKFNSPVAKIITDDNLNATGLQLTDGQIIAADLVISNADYQHTETKLLDEKARAYDDAYWKQKEIAPSGLIMYLGLNKKIEKLAHHTLFLDGDWDDHFDKTFDTPGWPTNPLFYLCTPSKSDNSVAPAGHENLFVLVPVSSDMSVTDKVWHDYYDNIMKRLEEFAGEPIKEHVVVKEFYSHANFATDYNAFKGTAFGLAHTMEQTAERPVNQSEKVSNLYYVGQYTQPGIGVPMVVISAQIVANEIISIHGD